MKEININPIIENIKNRVKSHEVSVGEYARWLWRDSDKPNDEELGVNAYGCADAANIFYTLNCFPRENEIREKWIAGIRKFQNKKTGYFDDATHYDTHTTAHCTAALELFDAMPSFPFYELEKYKDFDKMEELMETLSWCDARGPGHVVPAIYSAFVITGAVGNDWLKKYFDWLDRENDPEVGLWRKGTYPSQNTIWQHMGDGFHFLFTYEHAKRPFPNVERLIDTCIEMYKNQEEFLFFGKRCHFLEIDWVFCLNRASRQTKYRFDEIKEVLADFAKKYTDWLFALDWEHDDGANDLHLLFGTTCCLSELQLALPGVLHSDVPMRQVLDRRPFI